MNTKVSLTRIVTGGFTLVELMVSMAIISIMVLMLATTTHQASNVWRRGASKVEQFRESRIAFETITRRLGNATLNTYWDYQYAPDDPDHVGPPTAFVRQSELRFRSGRMSRMAPAAGVVRPTHGIFFQAPLGDVQDESLENMDRLLNTTGYFLEVNNDSDLIPPFLRSQTPPRIRSRLMELRKPAERLSIYNLTPGQPDHHWFADSLSGASRPVRVVAENIVALVLLPKLSQAETAARAKAGRKMLCPNYEYDSTLTSNETTPPKVPDAEVNPRNQLPPIVQIAMVALDEISGQHLQEMAGDLPDLGLNTTDLFQDAARLDGDPTSDLALFQDQLREKKLTYRLFTTTVSLRGAKWSRAQTQ